MNEEPNEQPPPPDEQEPTRKDDRPSLSDETVMPTLGPGASPRSGARAVVEGYEILGELGRGGMGVVYKARQINLGRIVALKTILAGAHASASELARFRWEAEAIARVHHPNIVQVYEVGETDGLPYFSLEFCGGGSLEQRLTEPMPDRQAVELVRTLAHAVHAAHQAGIIHRDLKPANVLLDEDGTPKITDFGLAKKTEGGQGLTQSGAVMGTPSYLAPEQAGGHANRVTTQADVYALGAILYRCLTGRPPFQGDTVMDTLMQVLQRPPELPSIIRHGIDRDLELICLKCLEKDPARRYPSADALAADLGHWLDGTPVSVRPPALTTVLRSWVRQSFGAAGWTVPVGLANGIGLSLFTWLLVINPALPLISGAHRNVTGEATPLLFQSGALPSWASNLVGLAALVVATCSGLLVVRLVRPANRQADVAAGLVTGFIAAVSFFVFGLGWLAVLAGTVGNRGIQDDLSLVSHAALDEDGGARARERLMAKYPRLESIPPRPRGGAMFGKIS
jgi:serine/threonine protein kinase